MKLRKDFEDGGVSTAGPPDRELARGRQVDNSGSQSQRVLLVQWSAVVHAVDQRPESRKFVHC